MATFIGYPFFINPLATGIVQQSHIGKTMPRNDANILDNILFLGIYLISISSEM